VRRWLLAVVVLAGCGGGAGGDAPADVKTRVPVGTATVKRDSLVETLTLTGRLAARPGGAADLTAPTPGVVRELRVQVGDPVRRGALLLLLDAPELSSDAESKTAAADQAEREAARQRRLLADGVTSARQAEEAAAAAQQATATAQAARRLLARTRLTSPINGRVQSVSVRSGERVEAGRLLVQVVAPDTLDLIVPVPATELARLRVGMVASVPEGDDSVSAPARIAALAPGVDTATNAGQAVIRVPNPGGRLYPGAAATARVRLGVVRDALVVPDSAITLAGDSSAVFVIAPDSTAHQRTVRVGVQAGGRTQVEGDLHPGDRVATTGAFGLEDGMHVVPSADAER
jgi:membrane fusion protein (multidrug efflux system)